MVAVGNNSIKYGFGQTVSISKVKEVLKGSYKYEGLHKVRIPPKIKYFFFRVSELIALVSVSTTLFLFIQTRDLSHRLHEIQDPNLDLSAFGAKIDSGKSGGRSIEDITKPKSHLSRELSNEKVKVNKNGFKNLP